MDSDNLFIVQRLPDFYIRKNSEGTVMLLKSFSDVPDKLIGFRLLDCGSKDVLAVIKELSGQLCLINIENSVSVLNNEPCLFVYAQDEDAVYCCLKHFGMAIAEPLHSDGFYCYL